MNEKKIVEQVGEEQIRTKNRKEIKEGSKKKADYITGVTQKNKVAS